VKFTHCAAQLADEHHVPPAAASFRSVLTSVCGPNLHTGSNTRHTTPRHYDAESALSLLSHHATSAYKISVFTELLHEAAVNKPEVHHLASSMCQQSSRNSVACNAMTVGNLQAATIAAISANAHCVVKQSS
jgi:hypothetical protein